MRYVIEVDGVTPTRKEALKHDVYNMAWMMTDAFLKMIDELSEHVDIENAVKNIDAYRDAKATILKVSIEDNGDRVLVVLDTTPLQEAIEAIKKRDTGILGRLKHKVADTMLNAIRNRMDEEIKEYAKDLENYGEYVEVYKEG